MIIYETVKLRSKNLGTILGLQLKCCYFDKDKGLGVVLNEISKLVYISNKNKTQK